MTEQLGNPVHELVVISLEAWDDVWRRNQHLVSRLLATDEDLRVMFVEPPSDPTNALTRRARPARGRGLRNGSLPGADSRLWLFQPTKWLPRRLDPWADSRLTSAVLRAIRRAGLTRPVLWINDPSSADLLRRTGWPALYDITDDWLLADRAPREHERLAAAEAYLLRHSRHVVVCSPRLLETKRSQRSDAITLIPNAVDLHAYEGDLPRPGDLPEGPTVLYVGTLHRDRLDVDLCVALASALGRSATFVLVGPVSLDAADHARLADAGAVLLGAREHASVPAYLKSADVLVVPHVVTAFTDSLDPIKAYEYLAAARPVVTTPIAGFREIKRAHVAVVGGDDLVGEVQRRLAAPGQVAPQDATVPSWTDRAESMHTVLAGVFRSAP